MEIYSGGEAPDAQQFRCICDPDDLFEPPDPTPRAVEGCPAHRVRRVAQRYIERHLRGDEDGLA